MNVKLASFTCLQSELGYLLCNFVSVEMLVYYQLTGQLTLVQYVRQHLQLAVVVSKEIQIEMSGLPNADHVCLTQAI